MYKVTYSLGYINRYVNLKFSVVLKNAKGIDMIRQSIFNGNQYLLISNLYPALVIELTDETKDEGSKLWNSGRSVQLNKFIARVFVRSGRELLEKFKTLKDLFGYEESVLIVNKDLAWENRVVIQCEYGKVILLVPSVVEDMDNHVQYEGLTLMINEMSNYGKFTYQEFESLMDYLDHFDFDGIGLQLLTTALLMRTKNTNYNLITKEEEQKDSGTESTSPVTEKETHESAPETETREWLAVKDTPSIPDI